MLLFGIALVFTSSLVAVISVCFMVRYSFFIFNFGKWMKVALAWICAAIVWLIGIVMVMQYVVQK